MSTPLNSLLAFRNIKIPTDRNDPNFKDKAQLESYKKNALTLTFRGTRTAPICIKGRVGRILTSPRTTSD
jgi:hypothetical protein